MTHTLQYLRSVLNYDPETGVFTWKDRLSNRANVGSVAGALTKAGYRLISIKGERIYAHRLAWLFVYGNWPTAHIDHKNRKPDDNRICNLRVASQSENLANISAHKDSLTGIKGITKKRGKWQARIFCRGKRRSLGSFDRKEDAAQAYAEAAAEMFGEFARAA